MEAKNTNLMINKLKKYSLAINSARGFRDILYQTCKAAVEIFGVDHSGFAIFEQDYSSFKVISEYPHNGPIKTINSVTQIKDSIGEKNILQNRIINTYNLEKDNDFGVIIKEMLLGFGIQSVLIIPVCVNNKVVASFSLDSIGKKKKFSRKDISICQILAGYTSIAMLNSKLLNENPLDLPIFDNSIKLNIDINSNYGLCVIDKNFKVRWTNDYYKKRFGDKIVGTICYEYIKDFKSPCTWCPHLNVLRYKNIYSEISPTPSKDDPTKLLHSQLLSFPLKFDNKGNIDLLLEILLEFSDRSSINAEKKRSLYANYQKLSNLLRKVGLEELPYLIGFYLINEQLIRFNEAFIYLSEIQQNEIQINPADCLIYYKNRINNHIQQDFYNLLHDAEIKNFNQIIGRIMANAAKPNHSTFKNMDINKYLNILTTNEPRRISGNEVAIIFPISNQKRILISVKVTDNNTILTESQFSDFAYLMPFIREVITTKTQISEVNNIGRNLKNQINEINIHKNILIHAAPFVIGKFHDVASIYRKIIEEVKFLNQFKWGNMNFKERNVKLSDSVKKIQNNADKLNLIMNTMREIVTLCTPKNETIDLYKIVSDLKELYTENLLIKTFDNSYEKKESIELIIERNENTEFFGDPVLFSQIFQNLIDNSIVAFQKVQRKKKNITISFSKTKEEILINYKDNASGIDPGIIDTIWEMYFSTKLKGTGLGLFFVKYIIKNIYNGEIIVDSLWGEFTNFKIKMPILPRENKC